MDSQDKRAKPTQGREQQPSSSQAAAKQQSASRAVTESELAASGR